MAEFQKQQHSDVADKTKDKIDSIKEQRGLGNVKVLFINNCYM